MDPADLLCNGILFLIFMIFAVLAIKHSPGGIVSLIIWAVVIIIVVGFIVYLTFGMLDMAFFGLMMAKKHRPEGYGKDIPKGFEKVGDMKFSKSPLTKIIEKMRRDNMSDYDKEIQIDGKE